MYRKQSFISLMGCDYTLRGGITNALQNLTTTPSRKNSVEVVNIGRDNLISFKILDITKGNKK